MIPEGLNFADGTPVYPASSYAPLREIDRCFWGTLGAHAIMYLDWLHGRGLSESAAAPVIRAIYQVETSLAERLVDRFWSVPTAERRALAEEVKAGRWRI